MGVKLQYYLLSDNIFLVFLLLRCVFNNIFVRHDGFRLIQRIQTSNLLHAEENIFSVFSGCMEHLHEVKWDTCRFQNFGTNVSFDYVIDSDKVVGFITLSTIRLQSLPKRQDGETGISRPSA